MICTTFDALPAVHNAITPGQTLHNTIVKRVMRRVFPVHHNTGGYVVTPCVNGNREPVRGGRKRFHHAVALAAGVAVLVILDQPVATISVVGAGS